MHIGKVVAWIGITVACLTPACGGKASRSDAPSPSGVGPGCTLDDACGGDPVGTWQLTSYCDTLPSSQQLLQDCGIGTITHGGPAPTGSLTFNLDGTFSVDLLLNDSQTEYEPTTCISEETCAKRGSGQPGVTCQSDAASCTCTFVYVNVPVSWHGTYQVSGATLAMSTNGLSLEDAFCVHGDTFIMSGLDAAGILATFSATR